MPIGSAVSSTAFDELDDEMDGQLTVDAEVPTATKEQRLEQAFVSSLLARPDLLTVAAPDDLRVITNETLRAMVDIAMQRGAAYTRPLPMMAELEALPMVLDGQLASATLQLKPEPDEVGLEELDQLRSDLESAARTRKVVARIDRAKSLFGKSPAEMVMRELREAIDEFDKRSLSKVDHTAKGALDRLRHAPPQMRWQIGYGGVTCLELDEPFKGIGPDGQAGYGFSGQNEVIVMAAGYGVGKTRVAQNWENALLLQPNTSIAHIMLEDNEKAGVTKLMGIHADVPFWQVEQYARGQMAFLGTEGAATQAAIEKALAWYENLDKRIRFYDGEHTAVNVFDFDQCLRLLELDVRLYKTTHLIVDYVQAFDGGEDVEYAPRFAQKLRAFAGRHGVNVIEISQISNATMTNGSAAGQVAAKGSGAWGQAAHLGLELEWDADVGQREICLNLKKARNGRRQRVYAAVNEDSGRIGAYYGTPIHMAMPSEKKGAGKGAKK